MTRDFTLKENSVICVWSEKRGGKMVRSVPFAIVFLLFVHPTHIGYAQEKDNMGPPENSPAWTRLGVMTFREGQYDEAIKHLDKAIALDDKNALAYFWRGRAKAASERYMQAIADFDKKIEIEPNESAGYIHRADSRRKTGDVEGAKKDMEIAFKLDPSLSQHGYKGTPAKQDDGKANTKDNWYTKIEKRFKALRSWEEKREIWKKEYSWRHGTFIGKIILKNQTGLGEIKDSWDIFIYFYLDEKLMGQTVLVENDQRLARSLNRGDTFLFAVPFGDEPITFDFKKAIFVAKEIEPQVKKEEKTKLVPCPVCAGTGKYNKDDLARHVEEEARMRATQKIVMTEKDMSRPLPQDARNEMLRKFYNDEKLELQKQHSERLTGPGTCDACKGSGVIDESVFGK